jgi:hypothetical protein
MPEEFEWLYVAPLTIIVFRQTIANAVLSPISCCVDGRLTQGLLAHASKLRRTTPIIIWNENYINAYDWFSQLPYECGGIHEGLTVFSTLAHAMTPRTRASLIIHTDVGPALSSR